MKSKEQNLNAYKFALDSLNEKGVPKSTITLLNELLEKQKPKSVKNLLIDGNYHLVCGTCEGIIKDKEQLYCGSCGQAFSLNFEDNKISVLVNRNRKGVKGVAR